MEVLLCQHCGQVLQYLESEKAGKVYGTCQHEESGCRAKACGCEEED